MSRFSLDSLKRALVTASSVHGDLVINCHGGSGGSSRQDVGDGVPCPDEHPAAKSLSGVEERRLQKQSGGGGE